MPHLSYAAIGATSELNPPIMLLWLAPLSPLVMVNLRPLGVSAEEHEVADAGSNHYWNQEQDKRRDAD